MISLRPENCLSKLERVKENILRVFQIREQNQAMVLYFKKPSPCALLCAFICEFLPILTKLSGGGKRKVILTITIIVTRHFFNINTQKKGTPDNGSALLNKMKSATPFLGITL